MRSRLTEIASALAALAVGGSAIASAAQTTHANAPPVVALTEQQNGSEAADSAQQPSAPDANHVQQGDQYAPDKSAEGQAGSEAANPAGAEADSGASSGN